MRGIHFLLVQAVELNAASGRPWSSLLATQLPVYVRLGCSPASAYKSDTNPAL